MKAARDEAEQTFEGIQGQAYERLSYEETQEIEWDEAWAELEAIFDTVENGGFPDYDGFGSAWENGNAADVMLETLETYRQELFIAADAVDNIAIMLADKFKRPRPAKTPITSRGQALATATEDFSPNFAEKLAQ